MTSDSLPDFVQGTPKDAPEAELAAQAKARAELYARAAGPLLIVEAVHRIDETAPLDGYQREMATAVRLMLADGVDALHVTQAVASVNDILTTRLLRLGETELGQPPCGYAWLALGSQGRGEQVLSSDQDNALAFDDRAEALGALYFPRLAGLVVPALARAGLLLCDGGYMATTWCRPLGEFRALFHGWVERPQPEVLVKAEVFMDVRPIHGDLPVDLLDEILLGGSREQFLVQMARQAVRFPPAIGIFGRLRTKDSTIDLKRGGIAAIVLLARLYGLAAGSGARTTVARLEEAAAAGTLSRVGAANLAEIYGNLTALRLRHQGNQADAGVAPDNLIPLDEVTGEERRRLRDGLRAVRDVQEVTAMRFATHTVT